MHECWLLDFFFSQNSPALLPIEIYLLKFTNMPYPQPTLEACLAPSELIVQLHLKDVVKKKTKKRLLAIVSLHVMVVSMATTPLASVTMAAHLLPSYITCACPKTSAKTTSS